jgi:hypothetical protein
MYGLIRPIWQVGTLCFIGSMLDNSMILIQKQQNARSLKTSSFNSYAL